MSTLCQLLVEGDVVVNFFETGSDLFSRQLVGNFFYRIKDTPLICETLYYEFMEAKYTDGSECVCEQKH